VPEGKLIGQKFKLADWQVECLEAIYDNPIPTRRAILSFGRKNGKTALAALLLLVHLCGPRYRPNSQLFSTAQSREQAALIFQFASKIVRMSPGLRDDVIVREAAKELLCVELGTRYRALSAEASTAFGLSPVFHVADELGQVRGPRSELFEALETATGAQENPLTIIISTQAPTDADLLSTLIDDALAGHDPRNVVKLYTAPVALDPFDTDTIRMANPAFGNFLNPVEVLSMAEDARRMPARQSEFENLILNRRVEVSNPFVSPAIWKANNGQPGILEDCKAVYGGLDLSEVADLTALVLIGEVKDKWRVRPRFWLPKEGLVQKAVADRVPWDMWAAKGLIEAIPGKTISYEWVANELRDVFEFHPGLKKIGFDRWGWVHLRPWLIRAGMSEQFVDERFVPFGQGFASMSPALRSLEQLLREEKIAHGDHPVLSMCVSNTVVTKDDAGNRKPTKKKSNGRIDGLVALAMACGVAPLDKPKIDVNHLIA
jgi:phage terminase large subunit-like protein